VRLERERVTLLDLKALSAHAQARG
jgi:hypothetical protein